MILTLIAQIIGKISGNMYTDWWLAFIRITVEHQGPIFMTSKVSGIYRIIWVIYELKALKRELRLKCFE